MHGTPFRGRAVQDAGEPFFFNAAFPHENFSSGENWNHYSPLLYALFIVVDICIRYKRFPARLATIATRKQRSKPAQNGLLFFAAKPPKTKKRPLRQQKKLHFDFSKCSFFVVHRGSRESCFLAAKQAGPGRVKRPGPGFLFT